MSTMRVKNKDGSWDKIPVLGSYQAVIAANAAASNAQNAAAEAETSASSVRKYKALWFNSVAAMKAEPSLTAGAYVNTAGYYEPNDGGGASYLIRAKVDSDVDDKGSIHELQNGLVAELIVENGTVNVKQFGAVGDGTTDDTESIKKTVSYSKTIFFPNGEYVINEDIKFQQNTLCDGILLTNNTIILDSIQDKTIVIKCKRIVRNWFDEKALILFEGRCISNNITIIHAEGAYHGMHIKDIFSHNIVTLLNVYNNKYDITLENATSSSNGYVNENLFLGGRFTNTSYSAEEETQETVAINFVDNGGNMFNNNLFVKPCFQKGNNGIGARFNRCVTNRIIQARCEGTNKVAEFSDNSYCNLLEIGYSNKPPLYTDNGLNDVVIQKDLYKSMARYKVSSVNDKYKYLFDSTHFALKAMYGMNTLSAASFIKKVPCTDGIINNGSGIGFMFYKSDADVFNISCEIETRAFVVAFDNENRQVPISLTYPNFVGTRFAIYNNYVYRTTSNTKSASFRVNGDYNKILIGVTGNGISNPENIIVTANKPCNLVDDRLYYASTLATNVVDEGDMVLSSADNSLYCKSNGIGIKFTGTNI